MTRYLATLVLQHAVNKLEAYEMIAAAVSSKIIGEGTSSPRIPLSKTAYVQVEIPKFGEPPPVAIDVWSLVSVEDARSQALSLSRQIEQVTGQVAALDLEAR
jgi:hypothetical protein